MLKLRWMPGPHHIRHGLLCGKSTWHLVYATSDTVCCVANPPGTWSTPHPTRFVVWQIHLAPGPHHIRHGLLCGKCAKRICHTTNQIVCAAQPREPRAREG